MGFSVRVKNLEEVLATLEAPKLLRAPLKRFFGGVGKLLRNAVRERAPAGRGGHPGQKFWKQTHLRETVRYRVAGGALPLWVRIRADKFTAWWFETTGAKPHPIGPWSPDRKRIRGRLAAKGISTHFSRAVSWGREEGQTFAAVKHPGMKRRPFMKPALNASLGAVRGLLARLGEEIRMEFDGGSSGSD